MSLKYKVYFISSVNSSIEDEPKLIFNYNESGITSLKKVSSKNTTIKRKNYILSVFCIEYEPKIIKEKDKNKITGKYLIVLRFNYNKKHHKKDIYIDKKRNNFIYYFEFHENFGNGNLTELNLDKTRQFKLFKETLNKSNIKSNDSLASDLYIDSEKILFEDDTKFYLDYYLELLSYYYNTNNGFQLLEKFEPKMVNYCEELDTNYYGKLLNDLQNNIEKMKQLNSKITKDVYLNYFTNLLVTYKLKYETEKIQDIINQESLWK